MQEYAGNQRTSENSNGVQKIDDDVARPLAHCLCAGEKTLCLVTGAFLLMPGQRRIQEPLEAENFSAVSRI
jgi:hypothetical protein